ncbi:MAG: hypothetical protein ACLP59_21110 [Bryobacteraceae bacterium]
MRRAPAILLLSLFSYALIRPALFADPESNLPVCCRRDGKHHCGMLAADMADPSPSGPITQATHVKCPLFPAGGAVLPHSDAALLGGSWTKALSTAIQTFRPAQAAPGYRISFKRSHRKRGPPLLIS